MTMVTETETERVCECGDSGHKPESWCINCDLCVDCCTFCQFCDGFTPSTEGMRE